MAAKQRRTADDPMTPASGSPTCIRSYGASEMDTRQDRFGLRGHPDTGRWVRAWINLLCDS
jgi:hypothetical protein